MANFSKSLKVVSGPIQGLAIHHPTSHSLLNSATAGLYYLPPLLCSLVCKDHKVIRSIINKTKPDPRLPNSEVPMFYFIYLFTPASKSFVSEQRANVKGCYTLVRNLRKTVV